LAEAVTVYVVMIPNGMILATYNLESQAESHARTVLGARVQALTVSNQLDDAVLEDIASDDWDGSATPVLVPESDTLKTQPSTPRSKARSKPPETK
jgi:hypothetical protein